MKRGFYLLMLLVFYCGQLTAQNVTTGRVNYGLHVPISVKFSDSSGDPQSWIGIYKSDAGDGGWIEYTYLDGKKSGEVIFKGEYTPGLYNFRLFKDNGYNRIATSRTIMVRQGMIADAVYATEGFYHWNASSSSLYNGAVAARISGSGKLVVAGQVLTGKTSSNGTPMVDFTVIRLWPDGKPDQTFGQNGRVTLTPKSSYFQLYLTAVKALAVQEDAKIVLGGNVIIGMPDNTLDYSVILVRLLENGSIDETFGDKGVVLKDFVFAGDQIYVDDDLRCMEITPENKILVGGGSILNAPYAPGRPFLGRFLPNGQSDNSFGTDGVVCPLDSISFRGYVESIIPPAATGDLTFYAAASAVAQFGANHQILYRFKPNGSLDKSFGTGGLVVDHKPRLMNDQTTRIIIRNSRGDIVMMGRTGNYSFWMTGHNAINGDALKSFGDNGVTIADPLTYCADIPSGMISDKNRIQVAFTSCLRGLGMSRFTPDGQIDLAFGYSIFEKRDQSGNYIEYTVQDFVEADTNRFIMVGSAKYSDVPHWETFVAAFKDNPEIITSSPDIQKTNGLTVLQNYPNPFHVSSKIPVLLERSGMVEVTLFDMEGRKTDTLFKGNLSPGHHEITVTPGIVEKFRLKGSFIYHVMVREGKEIRQESKVMIIE